MAIGWKPSGMNAGKIFRRRAGATQVHVTDLRVIKTGGTARFSPRGTTLILF